MISLRSPQPMLTHTCSQEPGPDPPLGILCLLSLPRALLKATRSHQQPECHLAVCSPGPGGLWLRRSPPSICLLLQQEQEIERLNKLLRQNGLLGDVN